MTWLTLIGCLLGERMRKKWRWRLPMQPGCITYDNHGLPSQSWIRDRFRHRSHRDM